MILRNPSTCWVLRLKFVSKNLLSVQCIETVCMCSIPFPFPAIFLQLFFRKSCSRVIFVRGDEKRVYRISRCRHCIHYSTALLILLAKCPISKDATSNFVAFSNSLSDNTTKEITGKFSKTRQCNWFADNLVKLLL